MTDPKPTFKTAADGHTYHKSANANATEAPTNEHTLQNVLPKLPMEQLDFITAVDMEYNLSGQIPEDSKLTDEYGFTAKQVSNFYDSPEIQKELIKRGLPLLKSGHVKAPGSDSPLPVGKAKLEPLQLVAANTLLDLSNPKSDKKKLQDIGVSTRQYEAWKRDPDFRAYLVERAESLIGDMQHDAMISLADNVKAGKMDAIKFYLELTGRYVPQSQQTQQQAPVDFQMMIVRIIEILDEEIDDPQIALKISKRLKALVSGQQLANSFTDPESQSIEQPEIAKPRELTPHVQEMMKRGLGYDS